MRIRACTLDVATLTLTSGIVLFILLASTTHAAPPAPTSHRGYVWLTQIIPVQEAADVSDALLKQGWTRTLRGFERTRRLEHGLLHLRSGFALHFRVGNHLWINISTHGSIASKTIPRSLDEAELWYTDLRTGALKKVKSTRIRCLIIRRADGLCDIEIVSRTTIKATNHSLARTQKRTTENIAQALTASNE